MNLVRVGCLLLAASIAAWAAPVTLTFGELPFQPVNGLTFQGVTFTFTIGGVGSTDANYNSGGPGTITFVQDPSLEGNANGVLTLDFAVTTPILQFGVARSTVAVLTPGFTVQLFDASLTPIGVFPVATTPLISFSEGQFTYGGVTPIRRAVITFDSPGTAVRFALDNLRYDDGAGCPPHTIHGHLPGPSNHTGNVHEHHGQHGHTVATGCPPHAPGHRPGLMPELGEELSSGLSAKLPTVVVGRNEDGSFNGAAGIQLPGLTHGSARRGEVLQLYGDASGLWLDHSDPTPFWNGTRLQRTSTLPVVEIGGVPARVLFSGLAPGLSRVWQITVLIPEDAPAGKLPVTVSYDGKRLKSVVLVSVE